MRELKFKALDKHGNWVYGLPFFAHGIGVWKITHSNGWMPSYNNPDEGECTEYTDVDPHTICQFTGLYDKYGEEIYEGDLVRLTYQYRNSTDAVTMFCVEDHLNWCIDEDYLDEKKCEVSIENGAVMFGDFDCFYHSRLLEKYMEKFVYGDENEENGEFGGTTFADYFDLEEGWNEGLGELFDYEESDEPIPENSKLYKEAKRLVKERLTIVVLGNIHKK